MKKTLLVTILASLSLVGCASTQNAYQLYAETQAKIAQANAVAETARFNALAEIAKTGDSAAKVAAVLSIQMNNGTSQRNNLQMVPPESFEDKALKWTSVLLPNFVQFYTINRNTSVAMRQSDNQAAIAISTNKAFTDISNAGHTANSNIANNGFSAMNTSTTAGFNALGTQSTAGFNALGTQSTAAFNALNSSTTAGFNALGTQSTAAFNTLQNIGVAGFNALKDVAPSNNVQGNYNVGENSGNSGKLAGYGLNDNTSTPTVVTQPAPTIVTQPTPTVVNPTVVTQPAPTIVNPLIVRP